MSRPSPSVSSTILVRRGACRSCGGEIAVWDEGGVHWGAGHSIPVCDDFVRVARRGPEEVLGVVHP